MKHVEEFRTDQMAFLKQERLFRQGITANVEYISFGRWLVRWEV